MRSFALPVLAFFLLAGVLAAAPDFTGTWIGKTEIPGVGMDELTLVIQKNIDAQTRAVVYSVTLVDTLGYVAPGTAAQEIKIDGAEMTFHFPIVDGSLIANKLTLKDEVLIGAWSNNEGLGAEMRLERKK